VVVWVTIILIALSITLQLIVIGQSIIVKILDAFLFLGLFFVNQALHSHDLPFVALLLFPILFVWAIFFHIFLWRLFLLVVPYDLFLLLFHLLLQES